MIRLPIVRGMSAVTLSMVAAMIPNSALGQENLIGTYGEVGTSLSFHVSDSVVQKLLPEGWQLSPPLEAMQGTNLSIYFVERVVATEPARYSTPPSLNASLSIPVRKSGGNTKVTMIFAGLTSDARHAPGPYGTNVRAKATSERNTRTDHDGPTEVAESWEFKGDDGTYLQLQLQYLLRRPPWRSTYEARAYSAIKPEFYLIHKIDSGATPAENISKYVFKAFGPKFSQIFDGSERLIGVESVPWLSRQVHTATTQ